MRQRDDPQHQRRDGDEPDREPAETRLPPTGLSRAAALGDQGVDDAKDRADAEEPCQSRADAEALQAVVAAEAVEQGEEGRDRDRRCETVRQRLRRWRDPEPGARRGHQQDHQQGGDDPGEQPGGGDRQPTAQGWCGGCLLWIRHVAAPALSRSRNSARRAPLPHPKMRVWKLTDTLRDAEQAANGTYLLISCGSEAERYSRAVSRLRVSIGTVTCHAWFCPER